MIWPRSSALLAGALLIGFSVGGCTIRYSQSMVARIDRFEGIPIQNSDGGFDFGIGSNGGGPAAVIAFSEPMHAKALIAPICDFELSQIDYRGTYYALYLIIGSFPEVSATSYCQVAAKSTPAQPKVRVTVSPGDTGVSETRARKTEPTDAPTADPQQEAEPAEVRKPQQEAEPAEVSKPEAKQDAAPAEPEAAQIAKQETRTEPEPEPAPQPSMPAPKPMSLLPGTPQIQLAATRSKAEALEKWKGIQEGHADVLGSLKPYVQKANLGERGIFYRLRTGPFEDTTEAKALCRKLAQRKVDCLVIGTR